MKNIYIYPLEEKPQNSAVLLRKSSSYYEIGEDYQLLNGTSNKRFPVRCVHKQTLKIDGLTSFHAYLLRDCPLSIYLEILKSQDFDGNQSFDFLLFSAYAYSVRKFDLGDSAEFRTHERFNNNIID